MDELLTALRKAFPGYRAKGVTGSSRSPGQLIVLIQDEAGLDCRLRVWRDNRLHDVWVTASIESDLHHVRTRQEAMSIHPPDVFEALNACKARAEQGWWAVAGPDGKGQ